MKTMTEREPQLQVASQLGALISEAASRPEVPSSRTISSALALDLLLDYLAHQFGDTGLLFAPRLEN